MVTIGNTVLVRGHAVEEEGVEDLLSQDTRVAVVQHARLQVTKPAFRVTLTAVVLTARGLGTPGVRAGDAAYRNKPERCVLCETQVVEEQFVRLDGAKGEAATLGCKLHIYCFINVSKKVLLKQCRQSFLLRSLDSRGVILFSCEFHLVHSSLFFPRSKISRVDHKN